MARDAWALDSYCMIMHFWVKLRIVRISRMRVAIVVHTAKE